MNRKDFFSGIRCKIFHRLWWKKVAGNWKCDKCNLGHPYHKRIFK